MLTKCRLGADGHWVDGNSGLPVTAVLPVHLYGLMADMKPILEVARKYNLKVVEDCAQAHGASYLLDGKKIKAGSLGRGGCLQLLPGQELGCDGRGRARSPRKMKWPPSAYVCGATMAQARNMFISPRTVGIAGSTPCSVPYWMLSLKKLDEWNNRRRQVAKWYQERLAGNEKIVLPAVPAGREHIYHLYVVRVPDRERVMKELGARRYLLRLALSLSRCIYRQLTGILAIAKATSLSPR